MEGAYAAAGVDYRKMAQFKRAMQEAGRATLDFPLKRGVRVHESGSYEYLDAQTVPHRWKKVSEGLGNKSWIAEWMYQQTGDAWFYDGIGIDTMMMAVVDLLRFGALPVVYTDEIAASDSEWFHDSRRRFSVVAGFLRGCEIAGVALVGGESPAYRYLLRPESSVKSAAVFSGSAVGIIAPSSREIDGSLIRAGDEIIGVASSGLRANGISLVIAQALKLPDVFFTMLPNGNTLGQGALLPTHSYVALMEALFEAGVEIHGCVPVTGDGVAKIVGAYEQPFTCRVHSWPEVPALFLFMRDLDVPLYDLTHDV